MAMISMKARVELLVHNFLQKDIMVMMIVLMVVVVLVKLMHLKETIQDLR